MKKTLFKFSVLVLVIFLNVLIVGPAILSATSNGDRVPVTSVTSITVTGAGGATTAVNGGTLAMSAAVLPEDATDKSVSWSVAPGTGTAKIAADGLLAATGVGTVTVTATANDGSAILEDLVITITAISTDPPITPTTPLKPEPDPWKRTDVKFYEKTETGFTTLFYSRFFRRPPDQVGCDSGVTRLVNGDITGADLINGFIFGE